MQFKSIQHFKFVSTHKFFVQPADENYLLARWMLINGFNREFFWQAMQAIEKYLKACLVLQEISIKDYKHKISDLFQKHCDEFGQVAFTKFEKPEELSAEIWTNTCPSTFVTRIGQLGDSDSRYGMVSWWRSSDDLFKLDQICWSLRRLTVGLKWVVGSDCVSLTNMRSTEERHTSKHYRLMQHSNPAVRLIGWTVKFTT